MSATRNWWTPSCRSRGALGTQFQVYQLARMPADAADVAREGVALRLARGSDLEILTGSADVSASAYRERARQEKVTPMMEICLRAQGWWLSTRWVKNALKCAVVNRASAFR